MSHDIKWIYILLLKYKGEILEVKEFKGNVFRIFLSSNDPYLSNITPSFYMLQPREVK